MKPSSHTGSVSGRLTFEPVTRANWDKFTALFGERGACASCWCMFYRLPNKEFREGKQNNGNREAMKKLIFAGKPVGIIALLEGKPVAWCAFAPREDLSRLANSRVHRRIDDLPVWSIPCFFIHKDYRMQGLSLEVLKGVIGYARKNKIQAIEAYPAIPTTEKLPDSFLWVGLYKVFEKAGFRIVDRKSKNRPMVRYYLR
ncbi:MAG TPA: GNAT family N-acetyltransferase [Bacteroidales bacterium]|nr:GNAT family N-acetyltransferase [Bacteroidales bacterium]